MRKLRRASFVACGTFVAQSQAVAQVQHHDWVTALTDDKDGIYAANTNSDGSVLMESCSSSSNTCSWLMAGDSICENGHRSPALINSDRYAGAITLTCFGKVAGSPLYAYQFEDWKTLESLIKDSKYVGVAVALGDTQFKVYRFSLFGMTEAQAQAEQGLRMLVAQRGQQSAPVNQRTSNSVY